MHAHAAETLAIGGTLAANAVAVSSVTAELRQAAQATRTQLAQVRAVMQLVQDGRRCRARCSSRTATGCSTRTRSLRPCTRSRRS